MVLKSVWVFLNQSFLLFFDRGSLRNFLAVRHPLLFFQMALKSVWVFLNQSFLLFFDRGSLRNFLASRHCLLFFQKVLKNLLAFLKMNRHSFYRFSFHHRVCQNEKAFRQKKISSDGRFQSVLHDRTGCCHDCRGSSFQHRNVCRKKIYWGEYFLP